MCWKNRHFAAIVCSRQQERKKKSLLFLHRGKRGAFSSPPLSLFLSFAGRAFRKRSSSSSSRNPSSWWSARREFKVSPIVPGAGVRRGGKRRTRRSSAKVEMSSTSSKDNATGATKPLCVKRFHPLHAPFYLFFFPPFFLPVIGNTSVSPHLERHGGVYTRSRD